MTNILEVKNLTKIFGKKQKAALEMVKQGKSKTEILEKTGATVGVYDASFEIKRRRNFRYHGTFWFRKINFSSDVKPFD